ncbi:NHLP bacteriocin export ABC transporter permease/ATPase subunit, partial [bacterium]|nr:NHLP bacteriocin export ABC transporter permease/ATPase subunit [bacterium]
RSLKQETITSENPYIDCVKLIGKLKGFEVVSPSAFDTASRLEDPVHSITRASGIKIRKITLKGNWIKQNSDALLAETEKNNPVVLIPNKTKGYNIYNPKTKTSQKLDEKTASKLKPTATMFYPPFPNTILKALDLFKFVFKESKFDLTIILLMAFLSGIIALFLPWVTELIVNSIIPGAQKALLGQMISILSVSAIAIFTFHITQGLSMLRLESKINLSLQSALWDRLLKIPVSFFRNYTSGDLANRALGINTIRQTISGAVLSSILAISWSSFSIIILFYYSIKLTLIAVFVVSFLLTIYALFYRILIKNQRKVNEFQGKISGLIYQLVSGISKIRITGSEYRAFSKWAKLFAKQRHRQYKIRTLSNYVYVINSIFPIFASIVFFSAIGFSMVKKLNIGEFLAFNMAFTGFAAAALQLVIALISSISVIPIYERLSPILETLPEVDQKKSKTTQITGSIEIDHVNFYYKEDGPLILNNLSLNANPGEFVAIVGKSGSGKSTLLKLLLGFDAPKRGSIYYDGIDLATLDITYVRRQIGVVLQSSRIMTGDIYSNIIGSYSYLTIEDAWEAARMVGLHEDIQNMPMGMHTIITEGGSNISGGQRQRILIARALVKQPKIIFFDEATSALDNKTQAIISENLQKIRATRIVIAHRLSTVMHADKIYVLDKGQIVEVGNYKELMKKDGHFAALAKRQLS